MARGGFTEMAVDDERAAIECELEQLRFRQPFPTAEAVAAHNARLEELTRRLQALPKRPAPVTGERAGSITIASVLGNLPPPDSGPAEDRGHRSDSLRTDGGHPWMPDD